MTTTPIETVQPKTFTTHLVAVLREHIPAALGFLSVLLYASGFLCVSTFLDRLGVHEAGTDFLKVEYVHVGILFLLFPLTIMVAIGVWLSIRHIQRKDAIENRVYKTYLGIYINACVVFYALILFAPADYMSTPIAIFGHRPNSLTPEGLLGGLILSSILGPTAIRLMLRKGLKDRPHFYLRISLAFFIVIFLDGLLLLPLYQDLRLMF